MPGFRLRWAGQCVVVDESAVIGRGEGCAVLLDDPLASRQHASVRVEDGQLVLTDLGSRNGVLVNGQRVAESRRLRPGDLVKVGSQEIRVLGMDDADGDDPSIEIPHPTKRFDAFGVVGELADKALALGHDDEAERLLSGVMEQSLRDLAAGLAPSQAVLNQATQRALGILAHTGRGVWLNWLVQLYVASRAPWPAYVVDQLYEIGRNCTGYDRQALRNYCELLAQEQATFGPAERFQIKRIEGLLRVMAAF